ncbi:MAG TPA: PAS domain S-box protein, partial [Anaerolineales bacterium]|nr:PAS domain S-box protein [Anaerolineales bacterium]
DTAYVLRPHGDELPIVQGVLVDITERKLANEALREHQERQQKILDAMFVFVGLFSLDGLVLEVNRAPLEATGLKAEEVLGKPFADLPPWAYSTATQIRIREAIRRAALGETVREDLLLPLPNNQFVTMDSIFVPLRDSSGKIIQVVGSGVDITARKQAEQQLLQMNRLYATLSQINQMIVRAEDQADLLRSACDILVAFGGFSFAWAGLLDESSGDVKPVAAHGLDLENWAFPIVNIHAGEYKHVLLATAIRMAKVMTTENLADDPNLVNFYDLIHKNDYRSAAAVPLSLNGRCIGVLSMVSTEAGVFKDEREIALLEEMQVDISFALEKIQADHRRQRAETDLRHSEERFYNLFHSNPNAVVLTRFADRRIIEVNDAFTHYTGYSREEALGHNTDELNLWADPQEHARYLTLREIQKQVQDFEWQYRTKAGKVRHALMTTETIQMQGEQFLLSNSIDITERKHAEQALQTSEKAYANLLKNISGAVYRCRNDTDWTVEYISEGCLAVTGYHPDEIIESRITSLGALMHPEDVEPIWAKCQINLAARKACSNEYRIFHRNGELRWVWDQAQGVYSDSGELIYIEGLLTDITELKEAEEALRQSEARQSFLVRLSDTLRSLHDAEEIKTSVARLLAEQLEVHRVFFTEFESNDENVVQHQDYYTNGNMPTISGRYHIRDYGTFLTEETSSGKPVFVADTETLAAITEIERTQYKVMKVRAFVSIPLTINNRFIAIVGVTQPTPRIWTAGEITLIRETFERTWDAVQRGRAQVALQTAERDYRSIFENAPVGIFQSTPAGRFQKANSTIAQIYGYGSPEEMMESVTDIARQVHGSESLRQRFLNFVNEQGAVTDYEAQNLRKDGSLIWASINARAVRDEMGQILYYEGFIRDITEHRQREEQIQRQLRSLEALHRIDMAITAGLEMNLSLGLLIEELLSILQVDAASILLFSSQLYTLRYAAGRGFRTNAIQHTQLPLGSGHAGRAAFERRSIHIYDLANNLDELSRSSSLSAEQFKSYIAIPLIAKGKIRGVLEIFHRSFLDQNMDWINFAETMANRAAIAIEDAQLVDELQRSNLELAMAYDATIEGWSRAMDLRDHETEGHTQRVTAMTLELAREMRLDTNEIVHMRRGALLHDIGKMGVPDAILLKPDTLTETEWEVMRRHPALAYEMLLPIHYLKPALDIPYCHHEKWDGTGYPRGLTGDEIPLAARIFTIVDVWDALTSDRSYRKAWSNERTIQYIREQSGQYFDPRVVEAFLSMLERE